MANSEKIYVGKGKQQFENLVRISVCLDDVPAEFVNEYNGKKYVSLDVVSRREVDQYGNSHYVAVNTYKPSGDGKSTSAPSAPEADMPF